MDPTTRYAVVYSCTRIHGILLVRRVACNALPEGTASEAHKRRRMCSNSKSSNAGFFLFCEPAGEPGHGMSIWSLNASFYNAAYIVCLAVPHYVALAVGL